MIQVPLLYNLLFERLESRVVVIQSAPNELRVYLYRCRCVKDLGPPRVCRASENKGTMYYVQNKYNQWFCLVLVHPKKYLHTDFHSLPAPGKLPAGARSYARVLK